MRLSSRKLPARHPRSPIMMTLPFMHRPYSAPLLGEVQVIYVLWPVQEGTWVSQQHISPSKLNPISSDHLIGEQEYFVYHSPSSVEFAPASSAIQCVSIVRMEGLNMKQSCTTAVGLLLLGLEKVVEFPHLIATVCIKCCLGPFNTQQWGNCNLLLLYGPFGLRYGFLYCFGWHLAV